MNFRLVNISDVFVQVAALFPAVRARHCRYFSVPVVFCRFLFARKTFKRIVVLTFAADATDTAAATEKNLYFSEKRKTIFKYCTITKKITK